MRICSTSEPACGGVYTPRYGKTVHGRPDTGDFGRADAFAFDRIMT
jgi:hypothetical protein